MNMVWKCTAVCLSLFTYALVARAETFSADLKVLGAQDVKLTQKGFFTDSSIALKSGRVQVKTEEQGTIFDSTLTISTADKKSFKFSVPKESYTIGSEFQVDVPDSQTGQNLGLRGEVRSRVLQQWHRLESQMCTFQTREYGCEREGNRSRCGYETVNHFGSQYVIRSYAKVQKAFQGSLVDSNGNVVVRLDPVKQEQVTPTSSRSASECNGPVSHQAEIWIRNNQRPVTLNDGKEPLFEEDFATSGF